MRGFHPWRQTPHPNECLSTSGAALSRKGRGHSKRSVVSPVPPHLVHDFGQFITSTVAERPATSEM
jgi:hypothetical protein